MLWWLHIVLFCIMVIIDASWTKIMWGFYDHNVEIIQSNKEVGLYVWVIPPIYGTMYLALAMICIPLVPTYDVLAGALVGFVVYGIYNMCMVLQFSGCNKTLACVDTLWGTVLFLSLTAIAQWFSIY